MIDIEKIDGLEKGVAAPPWFVFVDQYFTTDEKKLMVELRNAWPQIRRELEAGKRLRTVMVGVQSIVREHGLTDTVSAIDQALAQYDRSGT